MRTRTVVRILRRYDLLDSAVFYGKLATLWEIKKTTPTVRLLAPYDPSLEKAIVSGLQPFAFDVPWKIVTRDLVDRCHAAGVKVFSDLLGDDDHESNYREAIAAGVDLIQTDDVKGVKDCIRSSRVTD